MKIHSSLERGMDRLATHLTLEQGVAGNNTGKEFTLEKAQKIERTLQEIGEIVLLLETIEGEEIPADIRTRAEHLLEEWGDQPSQEWCAEVVQARYDHHISVYNHRLINHPAMKPMPPEKMRDAAERNKRAEAYGFRFQGFSEALQEMGFWQGVGPLIEERWGVQRDWSSFRLSLDDVDYGVFFNVLNGAGDIDYEGAFPELTHFFEQVKRRKFHKQGDVIPEKPSSLSTADIICALAIDRLNQGVPPQTKTIIEERTASLLDNDVRHVSNDERLETYRLLERMYEDLPSPDPRLVVALERAERELLLPLGHEGRLDSLEQLAERGVDAVIVLQAFGLGMEAYEARRVLQHFPEAFVMPSGGRTPHEAKAGQEIQIEAKKSYNEADIMIATLMREDFRDPYEQAPGYVPLPDYPPVKGYDILVAEGESIDTKTNAQNMRDRLDMLKYLKNGHSLSVVIVTTNHHGARAWSEFRNVLSREMIDSLKVWTYNTSPILLDLGNRRKPNGIGNMVADTLKRLYMITAE